MSDVRLRRADCIVLTSFHLALRRCSLMTAVSLSALLGFSCSLILLHSPSAREAVAAAAAPLAALSARRARLFAAPAAHHLLVEAAALLSPILAQAARCAVEERTSIRYVSGIGPSNASYVCMSQTNPAKTNIIGAFGLSLYTDDGKLDEVFGRYGRISKIVIIKDGQVCMGL